jgi:hypothetical protein
MRLVLFLVYLCSVLAQGMPAAYAGIQSSSLHSTKRHAKHHRIGLIHSIQGNFLTKSPVDMEVEDVMDDDAEDDDLFFLSSYPGEFIAVLISHCVHYTYATQSGCHSYGLKAAAPFTGKATDKHILLGVLRI